MADDRDNEIITTRVAPTIDTPLLTSVDGNSSRTTPNPNEVYHDDSTSHFSSQRSWGSVHSEVELARRRAERREKRIAHLRALEEHGELPETLRDRSEVVDAGESSIGKSDLDLDDFP
jgi:hypothetical protein